ncbi:MAG: hypothetical protein WDM85_17170 [Caulobacteraceae bacterium]
MTDTPTTAAPREGSLEAPYRNPIAWRDPDFYDLEKVEAEMDRVFDICHGCRRCFNLCDSFPRLFDMIDESPTGELDGVDKADYGKVTEACTLCDMCFMTKCPYVPPHEWAVDFPHLLLRHRAAERKKDGGERGARGTGRDRPQRQAGSADRRAGQLGWRQGQRPDPASHGGGARHRQGCAAAGLPLEEGHRPGQGRADRRSRRARVRQEEGGDLRHLLRRI